MRPRNIRTLWNGQVSKIKIQTRAVACSSLLRRAMTLLESLASTRCMSRWDEGSWDTIPLDTEGSPS